MKNQQVVPDYAAMMQTSGTVLCLVFSGWVLFRLLQAVFWLPGYLEKTQGVLYRKMEPKTNTGSIKDKFTADDVEEDDDGHIEKDPLENDEAERNNASSGDKKHN